MNNDQNSNWIKRLGLNLLAAAIPIILVILLEGALRVTGYGNDYPLVTEAMRFGKPKKVVNLAVAKRYFSLPEQMIPQPAEEIFDAERRGKSFRIICLGGSTTAGFPYEINATFPFQLQFRLRNGIFDHHVEVINLGISAVNSYTVLDILPEVLALQPDGLIIYMGHNEFYGALGVGSTQAFSHNRQIILAYLKLRRFRVVQLLRNMITAFRGTAPQAGQKQNTSLMQTMSDRRAIPLKSEKFNQACETFEENLRDIIAMASGQGVPVIIGGLVSNLKGQPPFISRPTPGVASSIIEKVDRTLENVNPDSLAGRDNTGELLVLAGEDSLNAMLQYTAGKIKLAEGDSSAAMKYFQRARDLDQLRFRAPGAFNEIIQAVTKAENVAYLDLPAIFNKASDQGIPGHELLLEHLHPNYDGYRLMAQSFYDALFKLKALNNKKWDWQPELLTEEEIQKTLNTFQEDSAAVTPLDLEFGLLRNYVLTSQWPFANGPLQLENYLGIGNPQTRRIAIRRLQEKSNWDDAHYEMARYYESRKLFGRAQREYRAVNLAFYDNYIPFMKIGDLHAAQENFKLALRWYNRALKASPDNVNVLAKMGQAHTFAREYQEALKYLELAAENDHTDTVLDNQQQALLQYLVAVCYANMKRWEAAEAAIKAALEHQPGYQAALKLQEQISQFRGK